jgi:Ca2+-binding RTX toxin-like protein
LVGTFLIGCTVLLLAVGCAGTSSETSNKKEQGSSPKATDSEEVRCEKTEEVGSFTTNDLPNCPKGGLLLGTDKRDLLDGKHGDDEVRGLDGSDVVLQGGPGSDILYGGVGDDRLDAGYGQGQGQDVMYGGDGNDQLDDLDNQRGKRYCGKGKDRYLADKIDYVDSSCEKKVPVSQGA